LDFLDSPQQDLVPVIFPFIDNDSIGDENFRKALMKLSEGFRKQSFDGLCIYHVLVFLPDESLEHITVQLDVVCHL
jgi:hypothetical protein